MKIFFTTMVCIAIMLGHYKPSYAQVQKGNDIDGEAAGDYSGFVSMPDANTVAIGAPGNNGNGSWSGHVRVFSWNGSAWMQKGNDIDGEAADDYSGSALSMPDANTVAIGAYYNNGNGSWSGHVRIYYWSGSNWVQKGNDIDGEAAGDFSGGSVSMPDANTVAIGAIMNSGNGSESGHVRIYSWNGSNWLQKGLDINGEDSLNHFGHSVSMPDSNTIGIGAPFNNGNGSDAGHVRIYSWNGSAWMQKGMDIDGEAADDWSGHAISMPDSNTIAIGAKNNCGNGFGSGHVRVYSWNGNAWMQKGNDIDGEAVDDLSGCSVSMPNSNTVAIGAQYNDGNGSNSGHVRIYNWNGSAWMQKGMDIDGEAAEDWSGSSVSMPDSNTVAIGSNYNDDNGFDAGHVRVYSFEGSGIISNDFGDALRIYPNPTDGKFFIDIEETYSDVLVRLYNALGQEILEQSFANSTAMEIHIPGAKGIYFVEIQSKDKTAVVKLIKE